MIKKYDVTGIGNAIVDILAFVEDDFLESRGLIKGSMSLIDKDKVGNLVNIEYDKISSGGSAANTIVGMANFGAKNAFIGKVGSGNFGKIFSDGLKESGVDFQCQNFADYGATARSFVLVSQDGQRTMATFLGDASHINSEIHEQTIADSNILYIEGYLWDSESTISALKEAIKIAKENDVKIAFTLSDGFCVGRHRKAFLKLIESLDILFANEDEIQSLLTMDGIDRDKIQNLTQTNNNLIIAVTRNEEGVIVFDQSHIHEIHTKKIKPVDSTGAGDAFAAGFLYSFINGSNLEKCGQIGNLFAGTIIQKLGGRFDEEEILQLKKSINFNQNKITG